MKLLEKKIRELSYSAKHPTELQIAPCANDSAVLEPDDTLMTPLVFHHDPGIQPVHEKRALLTSKKPAHTHFFIVKHHTQKASLCSGNGILFHFELSFQNTK